MALAGLPYLPDFGDYVHTFAVRLHLHTVVDAKLARVGAADEGGSGTLPRVMYR